MSFTNKTKPQNTSHFTGLFSYIQFYDKSIFKIGMVFERNRESRIVSV